jgi:hypothetical protein
MEVLKDCELPAQFDVENREYENVKQEFEKTHFQTMDPMCFWRSNKTHEGVCEYKQLSTQDFKTVCKPYTIEHITDKGMVKNTSFYKTWIRDPNRRVFETIRFEPYANTDKSPDPIFNTFDGLKVNKDRHIDDDGDDDTNIDNFMEFISNLVGEQEIYNNLKNNTDDDISNDCPQTTYLLKYLAHMFQFPEKRTETIICFTGWAGKGKDTLLKFLTAIMGKKYCGETSNFSELSGKFNDILDSKLAIFLNVSVDGVAVQEKLKGMATRQVNTIKAKYKKKVEQSNYVRFFVLSNGDAPINIQSHDRRYIVFMCGFGLVVKQHDKVKSKYASDFWDKLNDDLKNRKWLEKVYGQLMEMDLSGFRPDRSSCD